jgi:DUF305 family protein family protein
MPLFWDGEPEMQFRGHIQLAAVALTLGLGVAVSAVVLARDGLQHAPAPANEADERPFLDENDAAMTRMMNDMTVKPTGDIDRDFVAMMSPHHQGAIDMAKAQLRYGKNEQLRRIAQEIIVDQLQEIAAMKLATGDPPPPSSPSPTLADQAVQPSSTHGGPTTGPHDHMNMSSQVKK